MADNSVTVDLGATVDFSFPVGAGTSSHNVVFATNPTSCTQKTGVVIAPAPPLPAFALPAAWTGECTFNSPGHVHVRLLGPSGGDERFGGGQDAGWRYADADADGHADRDADGDAGAAAGYDAGEDAEDLGGDRQARR